MISPVKIWRRQKEIRRILGKKGQVITWTKILAAGAEFKIQAPYPVVLVQLDDGQKVFGQLVDYHQKDLKIGLKVISTLRKVRTGTREDIIVYGVKFKPIK